MKISGECLGEVICFIASIVIFMWLGVLFLRGVYDLAHRGKQFDNLTVTGRV